MIRFGLCCVFHDEPIKFRTTTAAALHGLARKQSFAKLSELCLHNVRTLGLAIDYCNRNGIGSFRVQSGLLPLRTHPRHGYNIEDLANADEIFSLFGGLRAFAHRRNIRTTFHPDQFVVLNSPRPEVVVSSLRELEHHAEMAELIGADVINIHAGGVYGDKESALKRLAEGVNSLSSRTRKHLTIENDDRSYSPVDLLPFCWQEQIPLVYDVHHHRCLPDGFSIEETTEMACSTWNREPVFHVSSPIHGWTGKNPRRHHDYIDMNDFPEKWIKLGITVEVEAKAKELAIRRVMNEIMSLGSATI
ncbi:MAG: UV DNA damage repair endonuclease UvsE [candidate division Zixibacteria bacterium]|nr:UV DNA damage repair endonuclease UvsE [candidate division Zixibacteria bacterium]